MVITMVRVVAAAAERMLALKVVLKVYGEDGEIRASGGQELGEIRLEICNGSICASLLSSMCRQW